MKELILIVTFTFISLASYGQSNPEDLIKKFFNDYPKNSNQAIDNLYATNKWTANIKDGISNMKKEVNGYTEDYMGKYYGYELITKKNCTENFVLYSYMVKYDRQPLKFVFEFYRPNGTWVLFSLDINATIDDDVEQVAKLFYYLDTEKK